MKPDPPRRKDGLCACGCGKKVKVYAAYCGKEVADKEMFATANCCRRYHELPLPEDQNEKSYSMAAKALAQSKYIGPRREPVGEQTREAKRRDAEARARLGISA